ncbi:ALDH-like protein [Dichomitus squalens LYAD-421 SS1]|uniref:aldehyde dehydrogenase (NAD(+)) n=1 Tax=Dichomitus squalens (strain LYAD-421) TaxID=732165 RepID=R7SL24_DICSQ|nr:ALDH-like protein [Dichomitus squalens LYAD-421 SS1]EJF56440.1 ALDH-like protein [Dichomitus squalens LYAD-421 SS1]
MHGGSLRGCSHIVAVPTHLQWLCCLRRTSLWRSTAVTSSSRYKLRGSSLFASFRITDLALSLAAGNATTWKLAPSAPLCSIAVIKIVAEVLKRNGMRGAVAGLVLGWRAVGGYVDGSFDVDVVSSTCSEAVGRGMSKTVQGCFGKVLLELGGNNAAVVMPSADLNIVLPAVLLGPIGTAGQHCTIMTGGAPYSDLASPLSRSCTGLSQGLSSDLWTGDVRNVEKWAGPAGSDAEIVIVNLCVYHMSSTASVIAVTGCAVPYLVTAVLGKLCKPAPVQHSPSLSIRMVTQAVWSMDSSAPVLTVGVFDEREQPIEWSNSLSQGLSSDLWTGDVRNVEKWAGPAGSDAEIVIVNVSTSGEEIGAAFGG